MIDRSNGYEGIAAEFMAARGGPRSTRIGAEQVRTWARQLTRRSAVLDLGCGSGVPVTQVLLDQGLAVYGVDASPSMVSAFKQRWPGGRLLFTSPAEAVAWEDAMTGRTSRSLGAAEYQRQLSTVGLTVVDQYDDEGKNHYFDVVKGAR